MSAHDEMQVTEQLDPKIGDEYAAIEDLDGMRHLPAMQSPSKNSTSKSASEVNLVRDFANLPTAPSLFGDMAPHWKDPENGGPRGR